MGILQAAFVPLVVEVGILQVAFVPLAAEVGILQTAFAPLVAEVGSLLTAFVLLVAEVQLSCYLFVEPYSLKVFITTEDILAILFKLCKPFWKGNFAFAKLLVVLKLC